MFLEGIIEQLAKDPTAQVDHVYVIPMEKFVYKRGGRWRLEEPVRKDGIINFLIEQQGPQPDPAVVKQIIDRIEDRNFIRVFGHGMAPWEPTLYGPPGALQLNTWVQPVLKPAKGEYPRIRRLLEWLTADDAAGIEWLMHWMAAKVQDPSFVPKVATVFSTQQGGGKGTLAVIMRHMLGFENTGVVQSEVLNSKFNASWAGKLFILADEVLSRDNYKDQSNVLKVLIDGNEISVEAKHVNNRFVKSQLAWMFASNDDVAPVMLESGDRRYSVFANHKELPADYVTMLNGFFKADRVTPTASFEAEIAALCYDLVRLSVDRKLIAKPHGNQARADLVDASLDNHQQFYQEVNECGIESMIEHLDWDVAEFSEGRARWDFGARGISKQIVYDAYVAFCERTNGRPLKFRRFCAGMNHQARPWKSDRIYVTIKGKGRKESVYIIPPPPPESAAA